MSTQFSDTGPAGAGVDPEHPAPSVPAGRQDGGTGAGGWTPAPPRRRSFWLRPWGIVTIVALALALAGSLVVGMVMLSAVTAPTPQTLVKFDEFYRMKDAPMEVREGLTWDISDATLNVYPTEPGPQLLYSSMPSASAAMRVEATLAEPAYADQAAMVWGIAAFNSASSKGVALLCSAGGTLFIADAMTAEPLPAGGSDIPCKEKMSLMLEVSGPSVMYGLESSAPTLYYGEEVYRDLDTVAIVVAAEKPDQKVRVTKIAVYQ